MTCNFSDEYGTVIKKWRKIVNRYSGHSTVWHDQLQDAIKAWQKKKDPSKTPMGHELQRDCKIKWGSLVTSLESGTKIREVLVDFLKYSTLALTEEEWDTMEELVEILGPCKVVIEAICQTDADLFDAEISFKWLFQTLESNPSPLAKELLKSFKKEIGKRWNPDLAGLLKYLYDPQTHPPSKKRKTKGKYLMIL